MRMRLSLYVLLALSLPLWAGRAGQIHSSVHAGA